MARVQHEANAGGDAALLARVARLCGVDSAAVQERLQTLWGGYGDLLRVRLGDGTSTIVKHVRPPRDDGTVSHRRKLRSYEVERAFYERYAARVGAPPACKVPRALGLLAEAGGWLFVLEDLDAQGYAERRSRASHDEIAATLRWLARFHARFMGEAPEGLWKVGTYWHLATRPDELRALSDEGLRRAAGRIDAALSGARYRTLVHGDAKLENVCFSAALGEVAMVDFQYVGGGVGVKDVAYFLSSCLSPRECEGAVPGYLDCYFRELALTLGACDGAQIEREWRELFPLAWVDFHRFFLGWARGARRDAYSEGLTHDVLRQLKSE